MHTIDHNLITSAVLLNDSVNTNLKSFKSSHVQTIRKSSFNMVAFLTKDNSNTHKQQSKFNHLTKSLKIQHPQL